MTFAMVHRHRGLHRVAIAAAACTLFLVFVGGSVTSNGAGMAVPDWPTTFGQNMFLYPPNKWVGGVLFEHTHRLLGAVTGLLIIVLAIWTQLRESRRSVRMLAWILVAVVVVQGVMGGLRVTQRSMGLAILHGCLAQLFFCMTLCMALCTSETWLATHPAKASPPDRFWMRLSVVTCVAIFGQSIAGAVYRHEGGSLAYHIMGAIVVTVLISTVVMWVSGQHADRNILMRQVKWTGGLLVGQLALGVGAFVAKSHIASGGAASFLAWFVPSVHVTVGALLLAVSVGLTISVYKMFGCDTSVDRGDVPLEVTAV